MDLQEFQRFIALSFRKLVVLRSEVFEEAEVPHLLVAENATFSEDALIIAKSIKYMKDHLEKYLYRQSKERILKIFQKIRELQRQFQEGCYYSGVGMILPNDSTELKRLLDAYFQSLANQTFAHSSQSISSNSSVTRQNIQSNPTIKSNSSTKITASSSTRKSKSPLPQYEKSSSQQMIRSKSSSSKHQQRASSSSHKRNATTIIQNKEISYGR